MKKLMYMGILICSVLPLRAMDNDYLKKIIAIIDSPTYKNCWDAYLKRCNSTAEYGSPERNQLDGPLESYCNKLKEENHRLYDMFMKSTLNYQYNKEKIHLCGVGLISIRIHRAPLYDEDGSHSFDDVQGVEILAEEYMNRRGTIEFIGNDETVPEKNNNFCNA